MLNYGLMSIYEYLQSRIKETEEVRELFGIFGVILLLVVLVDRPKRIAQYFPLRRGFYHAFLP